MFPRRKTTTILLRFICMHGTRGRTPLTALAAFLRKERRSWPARHDSNTRVRLCHSEMITRSAAASHGAMRSMLRTSLASARAAAPSSPAPPSLRLPPRSMSPGDGR